MTDTLTLGVGYTTETQLAAARQLAHQLQLPLIDSTATAVDLLLMVTPTHLELQQNYPGAPGPILVDFSTRKNAFRSKPQNLKQELLARAVHVKGQTTLHIIDATAGFGLDAFILASLGHNVQLLERSPIVAALLNDGLQRLATETMESKLTLIAHDAIAYLQQILPTAAPDVIYLDPMFPERTKSALVKKEMRLLQQIVGQDLDAAQLLAIARDTAKHKVVVKRPRLAPFLGDKQPHFSLTGKVSRFDIYSCSVNHTPN